MAGKKTEALEAGMGWGGVGRMGGGTGLVSAWQVRTEFLCVRIPTTPLIL